RLERAANSVLDDQREDVLGIAGARDRFVGLVPQALAEQPLRPMPEVADESVVGEGETLVREGLHVRELESDPRCGAAHYRYRAADAQAIAHPAEVRVGPDGHGRPVEGRLG